ncbi:MAG: hypothetical protein LBE85_10815 [Candidatus Accumulibacter sp.]|jgi:uncharacterized membrane protein|nr:hypothetical protein [Accumulibacter sp.]
MKRKNTIKIKRQNAFADLDDDLSTVDGANGLALVVNVIAFIVFWVSSGSFWLSLFVTFFLYGAIGAAAIFVVRIVAWIFARRDYDAPDA